MRREAPGAQALGAGRPVDRPVVRAVELRGAGFSYDDIGIELGYANRSGAWKAIQKALKAVQGDTVDEFRTLNLERLDALLAVVWPEAIAGDLKSVTAARQILNAQDRLLG